MALFKNGLLPEITRRLFPPPPARGEVVTATLVKEVKVPTPNRRMISFRF